MKNKPIHFEGSLNAKTLHRGLYCFETGIYNPGKLTQQQQFSPVLLFVQLMVQLAQYYMVEEKGILDGVGACVFGQFIQLYFLSAASADLTLDNHD